ncbi:hypothetical protein QUC31_011663 [Theobroma cacao]
MGCCVLSLIGERLAWNMGSHQSYHSLKSLTYCATAVHLLWKTKTKTVKSLGRVEFACVCGILPKQRFMVSSQGLSLVDELVLESDLSNALSILPQPSCNFHHFCFFVPPTSMDVRKLHFLSSALFIHCCFMVSYAMITTISLASNGLSGSLPQDICRHLPKLEALYLHLNEFSGQIPSSIDECSNLQNLTLYLNRFSGIIPRSIGNLTRLKIVDMSGNNLEGEIPWEIGNLLSLEEFAVGDMRLIVGPIPASIFNISSLKVIYLYNNSLSGSIPHNMCHHLVKLETFHISYNEISGHIPSNIGDCRTLQYLSLSYNRFSGCIPRSIGNSTKLKKIYVGVNDLKGKVLRLIS